MSARSVLRIGPSDAPHGDAAAALRSALAAHFRGDGDLATADAPGEGDRPLRVSNRYFDAEVALLGMDDASGADDGVLEDGMLLIFDAALPASFDALSHHHEAAVRNERCGDLLRLCIGAARGPSPLSDGTKRSEEEYSRRVLWCLDRGYEYVEVDLTAEGMARGFDDRDKDGFARVVEAIGTCMWSSRAMKPRDSGGGGADVAASSGQAKTPMAGDDAGQAKNDGRESSVGETQQQSPPETDGTGTADAEKEGEAIPPDSEREKAAMDSLMRDLKDEPPPSKESDQEGTQPQIHRQEEVAFHQLESVLSEAKMIREASKSHSMSDEERRERAGDTAMKLMGLLDSLGLDDLGLDDDTDDDSG